MTLLKEVSGGGEVITPAVTWATTIFPIAQVGMTPVLVDVDWDFIRFQVDRSERFWAPEPRTLDMPDPLGLTRSEVETIFQRDASLEEILDRLEASQAAPTFDA